MYKLTSKIHLRKLYRVYNVGLGNDEVLKCIYTIQYAIIGSSIDSYCNNICVYINPYPTAFPYGNGMVLHFYQQQESSTTKTVHKVINKGLKTYV